MEASANAQGEEESSVPSRVHFYEGLGLPEVGKEIAALEAAKEAEAVKLEEEYGDDFEDEEEKVKEEAAAVASQPTNLEPQETAMKTPSGGGGTAALAAAASAAAGGGGRGGGGGGDLQVAVETRAASGGANPSPSTRSPGKEQLAEPSVVSHKLETITKILYEAFASRGPSASEQGQGGPRTDTEALPRDPVQAAVLVFEEGARASPKGAEKGLSRRTSADTDNASSGEGVDFAGILAMARGLSFEAPRDALERSFRAALHGTILTEKWLRGERSVVRKIKYKVKRLEAALKMLDKNNDGRVLVTDLGAAIEGLKGRLDLEAWEVEAFMARVRLHARRSKAVDYSQLLADMCRGQLPAHVIAASAVNSEPTTKGPEAGREGGGRGGGGRGGGRGGGGRGRGGGRGGSQLVKIKPAEALKIPVKEEELGGRLDYEQFCDWYRTLPIGTRHRLASTPLKYILMRCPRHYQQRHVDSQEAALRRLEDFKKEEQSEREEEERRARLALDYPGISPIFQAYSMLLDEWRVERERRTGFSTAPSGPDGKPKRVVRDNAVLNLEEAITCAEHFKLIPDLLSRSELADVFRRCLPKNSKGLGLPHFLAMIEKTAAFVRLPVEEKKDIDLAPAQRFQALLGDGYFATQNIALLDRRLRLMLPRLVYAHICEHSACMREVKQEERAAEARRQSMRTERAGRLEAQTVRRHGWIKIMRLLQIGYDPIAPAMVGLEKLFRSYALRKEAKFRSLFSEEIATAELSMTLLDVKQLLTDFRIMPPHSVATEDANRRWLLRSTELVNLFHFVGQSVLNPPPRPPPPSSSSPLRPPSSSSPLRPPSPSKVLPSSSSSSVVTHKIPSTHAVAHVLVEGRREEKREDRRAERRKKRESKDKQEKALKVLQFIELVHLIALHIFSQTPELEDAYTEDLDKAAALHRRILADDHHALRDVLLFHHVLSPLDPWPEEVSPVDGHPELAAHYKAQAYARAAEVVEALTDLTGEELLAQQFLRAKEEAVAQMGVCEKDLGDGRPFVRVGSDSPLSKVASSPNSPLERLGSGSHAMKSLAHVRRTQSAVLQDLHSSVQAKWLQDPVEEVQQSRAALCCEEAWLFAKSQNLALCAEEAPHLLQHRALLEPDETNILLRATEGDEDAGELSFQERKARGCATLRKMLSEEAYLLKKRLLKKRAGEPRARWWELDTVAFTPELVKHNRILAITSPPRVGYAPMEDRSPQQDRLDEQAQKRRVGRAQRNGESWCAHPGDPGLHVPGRRMARVTRKTAAPDLDVEVHECGEEHRAADGWVWVVRSCGGVKQWVRTAFEATVSIQTTLGWDAARIALPSKSTSPAGRSRNNSPDPPMRRDPLPEEPQSLTRAQTRTAEAA